MKKFFKEFKEFISRGSVIDLAVGLVIGTAFTAIVNALVDSVIMPLIAAIFGSPDVSGLNFKLNGTTIPYGAFLQAILNFLLIAFFLFLVVKAINQTHAMEEKAKKSRPTKEEKAELAERGVNLKNRKEVKAELKKLREEKAAAKAAEPKKPTTEELLAEIRDLLNKQQTAEENPEKPAGKE